MKNLLYIGNKLSARGITATTIETLGPLLESASFNVRYASEKKNKLLRLLDMMVQTIRYKSETDCVIIDTYSTYNFWYAFAVSQLARILGIRYIPILHGGELPKRLQQNPLLCKMIFKHAYRNVAPSGYLLEAFSKAGFLNTIFIPNSIKLDDYRFKVRENHEPKLLWVRSFSKIYNPEMALHVLADLRKDFPNAQLCMIGPEKDGALESCKNLAKQMKLDVKFTGKLPKKEWVKLSEEYDIFINTTHYDNTPVSVIEIMVLGLPVVSTNVGGLPFLLEDRKTALLVNDNDVAAMSKNIRILLSDKKYAADLAINAFEVAKGFDSEKVKQQWFEILK
jgi:glycosyltransferase involved in cell wall biosynthesis